MQEVVRTKLNRGYSWPIDQFRQEYDVGDFVLFCNWYFSNPVPSLGKVTKITRTGKLHVDVIKLLDEKTGSESIIKDPQLTTKANATMVKGFMFMKLSLGQ